MPGTKRTCRSHGAGLVWSVDSIDMSHLRRWGIACTIWRFFNRLLTHEDRRGVAPCARAIRSDHAHARPVSAFTMVSALSAKPVSDS